MFIKKANRNAFERIFVVLEAVVFENSISVEYDQIVKDYMYGCLYFFSERQMV